MGFAVAVALAWACAVMRGRRRWVSVGVVATIAVAGAVILFPVWTGHLVPSGYLQSLVGG